MVNNFKQIRDLLKFEDEGDFYFLQIIKRRKDNPEMTKGEEIIRDYYIYSVDEFDKLINIVVCKCEEENARAYFRLNKRNDEKIALQMIKRVADCISSKNYKGLQSMYPSLCGQFHSADPKTWILDVDEKDHLGYIKDILLENDIRYEIIPTKNGYHLITNPFDSRLMPTYLCDIHKDNPTILYIP